MKEKYYPPQKEKQEFHCPYCGVFAHQYWGKCYCTFPGIDERHRVPIEVSCCAHCNKYAYWLEDRLLFPSSGTVELPNSDLPEECREDYIEARDIVIRSPKGAAALLRLCIQKLLRYLGKPGKNINSDIADLVKDGLPVRIQQSLDICRVVGNNALHPGEISIDDNPEIAHSLFRLINFIVEDQITKPKEIETLYMALPAGALEAIETRDQA